MRPDSDAATKSDRNAESSRDDILATSATSQWQRPLVDCNWQSIPGDGLESKSPQELWDLFRARDLHPDLTSFTVQNACSLVHLVLTTAAPDDPASGPPPFGGTVPREGAEDPVCGFVGVELFSLAPIQVRQVADFFHPGTPGAVGPRPAPADTPHAVFSYQDA